MDREELRAILRDHIHARKTSRMNKAPSVGIRTPADYVRLMKDERVKFAKTKAFTEALGLDLLDERNGKPM